MAREDYLDEVRLQNALNKQKAMQGASAAAQAAEKSRREREIFQEMMAGLKQIKHRQQQLRTHRSL